MEGRFQHGVPSSNSGRSFSGCLGINSTKHVMEAFESVQYFSNFARAVMILVTWAPTWVGCKRLKVVGKAATCRAA